MSIIEQTAFTLSSTICKLPEKSAGALGIAIGLMGWKLSVKERKRISDSIGKGFLSLL